MHLVTDTLDIAFEWHGPERGWPVVLLHRFPYDVRTARPPIPLRALGTPRHLSRGGGRRFERESSINGSIPIAHGGPSNSI